MELAHKPLLIWRAVLFYIVMVVTGVGVGIGVLLIHPFSKTLSYRWSRHWAMFMVNRLRQLCGVNYQISGTEHLPTEPVIVLAKHQSAWETLFLHGYLPHTAWVLKRELLWIPIIGWAMRSLQPIAINRKASSVAISQILEQGQQALAQGRWVVIFPEGTRSAPGQRGRYKLGGARLAAHSGYPVLPIAHNAGEFWRRRGFIKTPGTIQVVIGPVLATEGLTPQQINHQVEEWIENTVQQISSSTT